MEKQALSRLQHEEIQSNKIAQLKEELQNAQLEVKQSEDKASGLRSAFNADKNMYSMKIDDLEKKLTHRINEVKSLEQKIHMLC
mmetsp:Transcript_21853/g.33870  ORF Transcript_21853/g.33870 Transcript_21853/m.33870 type:complete len:84 (-) Transcript_21853:663-914(-)|eukprot:CAMPEP_0170495130 /NCGR_PEP_ID=MMETSP0208-20121228/15030_1 /TAXON_ID=197538 /ORGANISM="Strombidium inclinatum, Strain S3" /LENGTH=83 /DNA_ID=CAMNT_0010771273 /DNA_START=1125 /DNA_END=1376 /DNA_ORIENTATION=+